MSDYNTLLAQVEAAIDVANSLSKNSEDNFAACAAALEAAKAALIVGQDQSAICQCLCHTSNPEWHSNPCGCLTGNPYLGF